MARLGAPTPTPAAPVLVPIAPHAASDAASTRPPSCRAIASPPLPDPGRLRSALGGSTIYPASPLAPLRVSGAASTRRCFFCLLRGALPGPAQTRARSPSHCPPPASPAAARSSLRLRSPPRPSLPRAPRSRRFVCLRAQGSFCVRRGAEDDLAHPLGRAKDRHTAPRRLSLHHTHSLPLSNPSDLPPHPSPPSQPPLPVFPSRL